MANFDYLNESQFRIQPKYLGGHETKVFLPPSSDLSGTSKWYKRNVTPHLKDVGCVEFMVSQHGGMKPSTKGRRRVLLEIGRNE